MRERGRKTQRERERHEFCHRERHLDRHRERRGRERHRGEEDLLSHICEYSLSSEFSLCYWQTLSHSYFSTKRISKQFFSKSSHQYFSPTRSLSLENLLLKIIFLCVFFLVFITKVEIVIVIFLYFSLFRFRFEYDFYFSC